MPDQIDPPSFHVRLPAALQKRLKIAAVESDRSMNARDRGKAGVVVRTDRQRARRDQDAAGQGAGGAGRRSLDVGPWQKAGRSNR